MACREVGRWITENVTRNVEKFFETWEEKCHEVREWVEREIREPIERRRTRQERKCKRRKCNWWCACCNKWFCWLETIIEVFIEWVVKVVGEWLIETVCELVAKVVKVIVQVVVAVVKFVVTGVVCLFTDPLGALAALGDLWMDILNIIDEIGDIITGLIDDIADLIDLTKESILDLADLLGPFGRFFLGIVAGVLDIIRGLVEGIGQIVEGVFDVIGGILSLDFCRVVEGLAKGVGLGLLKALTSVLGVLSLGSRGVIDAITRDSLRDWLQGYLEETFEKDPERLANLEDKLKMDSSSFGIDWTVLPFISAISSRSPHLDLRAMHRNGTINLYAVAGYAPIWCDKVVSRNIYRLVYKDTDRRVSINDIRYYLSGSDNDVPEFQLQAGDRDTLKDMLRVAKRKFAQIAIDLHWGGVEIVEITQMDEFTINGDGLDRLLNRMTADLGLSDVCDLPSGFVFGYEAGNLGRANVWWRGEPRKATGATVRPGVMTHVYGTIMAHEMGHCFSLCHSGHDGLENIMFTMADGSDNCGINDPDILNEHDLSPGGPDLEAVEGETIITYLMTHGEPVFTLLDGKNAWRWILNEAIDCV